MEQKHFLAEKQTKQSEPRGEQWRWQAGLRPRLQNKSITLKKRKVEQVEQVLTEVADRCLKVRAWFTHWKVNLNRTNLQSFPLAVPVGSARVLLVITQFSPQDPHHQSSSAKPIKVSIDTCSAWRTFINMSRAMHLNRPCFHRHIWCAFWNIALEMVNGNAKIYKKQKSSVSQRNFLTHWRWFCLCRKTVKVQNRWWKQLSRLIVM